MKYKTKSFLRREEYKALSSLRVDGDILDVGGSKKSGYHELISGNHKIITGNIDASYGADIFFDAQKKWPFDSASFSCVLFVNVLEHLFDYNMAVGEAHRVLKNGGKVVGVIPFMLNVHGTPNDYFRYTKPALEKILSSAGFKSIGIRELGSGAFGVIYQVLIGFARWEWLATVGISICKFLDGLISALKPGNKMTAKYMPLGYYFEAIKP
jgi:SAM-dependent methyltransferase